MLNLHFRAFGPADKLKELIEKKKGSKLVIDTANPNVATREQVLAFLTALKRRIGYAQLTPEQQATLSLGLCELLQKGAVSPKFDKSRKAELFEGNLTAGNI